ncbi:hypothetical protein CCR75_004974 [Bremia lactucae]|uniref:Protein phosphatase inhibitor n=1 Tax=Bremia lactucae TaxID=4779 RepID=A0A976FQB2_BRELC|nr:hypothetical protein CCR75_004974 [Bremia lactucae]
MAHEDVATVVVTTPSFTSASHTYRMELQPRPHVTFDENVVNNEHLGRKRSNKCCIFHKKRDFGESSSESDDESDESGSGEKNHRHAHDCKHKGRLHPTRIEKRASPPRASDNQRPTAN